MKNKIYLFATLFTCVGLCANAQLKSTNIIRDTIYSNELKEKRPLEIVLPGDYNSALHTGYDVTYVTDGEWNTQIVTNIDRFLSIQFMPSNIIVSIPNLYINHENMRERDFTPTHIKDVGVSGGADHYLAFLKNELMPYINKKYHTSSMNTLYGSSLGGIFTMYAFVKEPRLFQSYLLADPSLWWDNGFMFKLVSEKLSQLNLKDITLLMTGREGETARSQGIIPMDSIFRKNAPAGLHWKTMYYNDETHNSMIFRTLYDGLKYTYYGYSKDPLQFHPMNGIMLKGEPVKIRIMGDLLKELRYTTDGTEPTAASARIEDKTLTLPTPAHLMIKALSNRPALEQQAAGTFTLGTILKARPILRGVTPNGWGYAYYEGSWDRMPDFKKLKPVATGKAGKEFDPTKLPRQQNFGCVLSGQLQVMKAGYHMFVIDVDGGARLYIDDQLVIDYDGLHTAGNFQSYELPLAQGFHNVKLEYFEKTGNPALRIIYTTSDNYNGGPIPLELQYGR